MAGTSRIGVGLDVTAKIRQMEDRTLMGAPKEFTSPVDWNSVLLNTGLNVAQMGANVGVDIETKRAQRAIEENLTPEETQKRISPALNTLSWLSLVSPQAGQAARNIQQTLDVRTIQQKQATDRMNEKLMLSEIADYARNSTSPEEYKAMVDKAVDQVRSINTTGVSNEFISAAGSYASAGSLIIENHNKGLKYGNTAVTFANKANRSFINQNTSPTAEDIDGHMSNLKDNLGATVDQDRILSQSLFDILSVVGEPEVVAEILAKEEYSELLTLAQQKNLTLLADSRSARSYRPSSDPLMALIREKNLHGIAVPIDKKLLPPHEKEAIELNEALTESVNLRQMSPAALREYANKEGTPRNLGNLAKVIARNIEVSFNNDAVKAIKDFDIKTPDKKGVLEPESILMPVLDKDRNLQGTTDFIKAIMQRVEEVGYVKNDWFQGTRAIQNILSKDEKDQLMQLSKQLSPEQRWGLANNLHDVFSNYNKKLTNERAVPFSEQKNIADMFQDPELGDLLILQNKGEITEGSRYYSRIKNAELVNPGGLSKLRSNIGKMLVNDGLSGLSPALKTMILGKTLTLDWPVGETKFDTSSLEDLDFEAIPSARWGTALLVEKGGAMALEREAKKQAEILDIDLAGKINAGLAKLVQKPNSLHEFYIFMAFNEADAAAGNHVAYSDKYGKIVVLDYRDAPPPPSFWERVGRFAKNARYPNP